jgi:hypothetical protein
VVERDQIIWLNDSLNLINMRGGKRPGAGRKKGFAAKSAEEARRVFAEAVSEQIGPITDALVKKASKGDIRAAQLLFERAWGKASSADILTVRTGPRPAVINYIIPKE